MRKGERKRQDILAEAAALFARKGYIGTSIQDILDALDCSKGSFYHHFNTKFELLAALAENNAALALKRYQASPPSSLESALDSLFHEAGCLNRESLPLLADLLALRNTFEGGALLFVMQDAARRAFSQPFLGLLHEMRKKDKAVYASGSAPEIAFQSFLSGCALIVFALGEPSADREGRAAALLRALRGQLEAGLGLNPGAVVILEQEELLEIAAGLRP